MKVLQAAADAAVDGAVVGVAQRAVETARPRWRARAP